MKHKKHMVHGHKRHKTKYKRHTGYDHSIQDIYNWNPKGKKGKEIGWNKMEAFFFLEIE